jgi:hypothetical protein
VVLSSWFNSHRNSRLFLPHLPHHKLRHGQSTAVVAVISERCSPTLPILQLFDNLPVLADEDVRPRFLQTPLLSVQKQDYENYVNEKPNT